MIEDSPETFFERFQTAAFTAEVLPAPCGQAALDLVLPQGILRVFDRGAPPLPRGPQKLILHGVMGEGERTEEPLSIQPLPGGEAWLVGFVKAPLEDGFYLVESTVPFVVWSNAPLPLGERYKLKLASPLMGFRP